MATKLTPKQRGFIKDYLATGNATEAALKNYDTEDEATAAVIGYENLRKPKIEHKIQEVLNDDLLASKHTELLEQKRIDYFVFPNTMEDKEIIDHVASVGITVITVRKSDKGKMAFYSLPDGQAIKGALDMAYKLKGLYAPEKTVNLNVDVEADSVVRELTQKLNGVLRGTGIPSDGGTTRAVDTEAQDKE